MPGDIGKQVVDEIKKIGENVVESAKEDLVKGIPAAAKEQVGGVPQNPEERQAKREQKEQERKQQIKKNIAIINQQRQQALMKRKQTLTKVKETQLVETPPHEFEEKDPLDPLVVKQKKQQVEGRKIKE